MLIEIRMTQKTKESEKEMKERIYENILKFIHEDATYIQLSEIARNAYHLKMEKERAMQSKYS